MPAVRTAREYARRTQCQKNLLQMGLALHNHQHAHSVLSPGCVSRNCSMRNRVEGYHFGWMVQILPMLQQTAVWNRFDFGRSVDERSGTDSGAEQTPGGGPLQQCPSRRCAVPAGGWERAVSWPVDRSASLPQPAEPAGWRRGRRVVTERSTLTRAERSWRLGWWQRLYRLDGRCGACRPRLAAVSDDIQLRKSRMGRGLLEG